jgi:hypothetical protein
LRHQQNVARNPSHKDLRYKRHLEIARPSRTSSNLDESPQQVPGLISSSRCQTACHAHDPCGPKTRQKLVFRGRSNLKPERDLVRDAPLAKFDGLVGHRIRWRLPKATGSTFRLAPKNGGARRDRTDDLLLAKQALSQLSYGPG